MKSNKIPFAISIANGIVNVLPILEAIPDENVKMIWDVLHSTEFDEEPEETLRYLDENQ